MWRGASLILLFGLIALLLWPRSSDRLQYRALAKNAAGSSISPPLEIEGEMTLENDRGKVSGKKIRLEKGAKGFSLIELSDEVELQMASKGTLYCSRLVCDLEKRRLVAIGAPVLHFVGEKEELWANGAELWYAMEDGPIPLEIRLEGDVMYTEAERSALADRVIYRPQEHTIHLFSVDHPVLFIDRDKKIEIAASEVVASDQGGRVEAFGQVRCKLSMEEIDKLVCKKNF